MWHGSPSRLSLSDTKGGGDGPAHIVISLHQGLVPCDCVCYHNTEWKSYNLYRFKE